MDDKEDYMKKTIIDSLKFALLRPYILNKGEGQSPTDLVRGFEQEFEANKGPSIYKFLGEIGVEGLKWRDKEHLTEAGRKIRDELNEECLTIIKKVYPQLSEESIEPKKVEYLEALAKTIQESFDTSSTNQIRSIELGELGLPKDLEVELCLANNRKLFLELAEIKSGLIKTDKYQKAVFSTEINTIKSKYRQSIDQHLINTYFDTEQTKFEEMRSRQTLWSVIHFVIGAVIVIGGWICLGIMNGQIPDANALLMSLPFFVTIALVFCVNVYFTIRVRLRQIINSLIAICYHLFSICGMMFGQHIMPALSIKIINLLLLFNFFFFIFLILLLAVWILHLIEKMPLKMRPLLNSTKKQHLLSYIITVAIAIFSYFKFSVPDLASFATQTHYFLTFFSVINLLLCSVLGLFGVSMLFKVIKRTLWDRYSKFGFGVPKNYL
ncbi:MAG: hypothetical protein HYV97_18795 [Bdellovibrio sp.]|nr:hypothetical protein [Bdellovibrio sp.]